MGNEKKEGVVEQLEDMLGLGKETPVDTKEENHLALLQQMTKKKKMLLQLQHQTQQ